jgi:hypothetical protein
VRPNWSLKDASTGKPVEAEMPPSLSSVSRPALSLRQRCVSSNAKRHMEHPQFIKDAEAVIESLGYWPSFHDAEVVKFSAERALPVIVDSTLARLVVHVRQYATTGEGTAQCQQVLTKSVLIHFCFKGVSDLDLSDFNHQNVINALGVSQHHGADSPLIVEVESIWGLGGSFQCVSATVEAVEVLLNAAVKAIS